MEQKQKNSRKLLQTHALLNTKKIKMSNGVSHYNPKKKSIKGRKNICIKLVLL